MVSWVWWRVCRRQQHLVPGVHFPGGNFVAAAAAGNWLKMWTKLVWVSRGGRGERWAMGVRDTGEMTVSWVLDPTLSSGGRRKDCPVSDQGELFVIVLIVWFCHLPWAICRNLNGLLTVFLVQGTGRPTIWQRQGLFGGFKQGEERAIGCGGRRDYWVVGGNRWGV